jgi:hypothetical protein
MTEKETSCERLCREAAELRETAVDMMEHAALLIAKSVELEKKIARLDRATRR